MPSFKPLDPSFTIQQQLDVEVSPVVLINLFVLDQNDESALLEAWKADAEFMKTQPGFVSTQLHRALGPNATFLNYAVWESTSHFRAAFTHPEFRAKLGAYPSSTVASPHLFQKFAVDGVCAD